MCQRLTVLSEKQCIVDTARILGELVSRMIVTFGVPGKSDKVPYGHKKDYGQNVSQQYHTPTPFH